MESLPTEPKGQKKFMTVKELVDRWSISKFTIGREVARKRLKKTMIAGSVRFAISEVERYERTSQS